MTFANRAGAGYHSFMSLRRGLLLLALGALAVSRAPAAEVDTPRFVEVPLSSITTPSGGIDLGQFRGSVVYVDFWASWCRPCHRSFDWMARMHAAYAPRGLVVLAVNLDRDREGADRFLQAKDPAFRIAFDPEAVLARSYDLEAMPSSFIYASDGTLRHAHVGFRDGDADELESVIALLLAASVPGGASR
jgi:cytochrome c biogenesis protein CcmG/thiol:disulfide interchange protein DsbE